MAMQGTPQLEPGTIRELIHQMAQGRPDASFLLSPETRLEWTFAELDRNSIQVAQRFLGWGLRRGDKIAFMLDNGIFTAGLFLGAMYGGFVPVPLNVRAGQAQLAYMLDHSDACVVFVSRDYEPALEEARAQVGRGIRVIRADVDHGPNHGKKPWLPDRGAPLISSPDSEALLIYTSGSTGQPKGRS